MLTHPEIECFFWIDSDAIFTDMLFEAPFDSYDRDGINMVMWGYEKGFFVDKSWVAFNAGVFIIRNCQWSLDLIDKWSPMGPSGRVQVEYGKMLTSFLSNRVEDYPADDQSALAYLILTDEAVKSKVKLVDLQEYMVSAWWVEVVDTYEQSMEKYHPGFGDWRWPWITHFTGCGPCGSDGTNPHDEKCMAGIERALNFADNQVLAYMGYKHENLSSNSVVRIRNETDRPLDFVGVNPWQDRLDQVTADS
jgi:xyloglucan 6-xylosyltransferase